MHKVTIRNGETETIIHSQYLNGPKLLSGNFKEEINMIDNLTFSLLPNNPGYNKINPLKTLITVENADTGEVYFDGFVFMPTDSMDDEGAFDKSFTALGELAYLTHSVQRQGEYHDITVEEFLQVIIDNHNRDLADDPIDKQFVLGKVDVGSGTLYRYLGYEDTLATIKDKLIDRLGGELRVRKENGVRYLDYLQVVGELEETEIKLAKNLLSITRDVDPNDLITRLVPLGARIESEDVEATDASEARVTIESVNDGKDLIVDHAAEEALGTIRVRSEVFEGINVPSILKTRGKQFLDNNNRMKIQHSLSALDLSIIGKAPGQFKVGSWYPTKNQVMGIDEPLRIVAKTTDILEPWNNGLTIGDKLKTASQYQAEANKQIRMVGQLQSRVSLLGEANVRFGGSLNQAKSELDQIQEDLNNINFDNLPVELQQIGQKLIALQSSVDDIDAAIAGMPNYGPATSTKDGLLTSNLYMKLIAIDTVNSSRNGLMLKEDKTKLNKIMVVDSVDLDALVQRIEVLENEEGAIE